MRNILSRKFIRLVTVCLLLVLSYRNGWAYNSDTTKTKTAAVPQTETAVTLSFDPLQAVPLSYWLPGFKTSRHSTLTIHVESINMTVKDGFILNITVHANGKEFTNLNAPIAITSQRLTKGDFLANGEDHSEGIILYDLLKWQFNNDDVPDDSSFTLDAKNPSKALIRNLGVDNVLSLQLYTDALGLFGGTPNSLAQAEAQYRHIISRHILYHGLMIPGQYIKLNFSASKFDSKKRFVDSASFSRASLLQKSYLNFEASSNLLYCWVTKKSASYAYLDLGAGINEGIIAKKKDTSSILTPNIFWEAGLNLRPSNNIGVDLSIRYINQYSPQTNFLNSSNNNQSNQEQFWKFGAALFFNPVDNSSGRIFARGNYLIPRNHMDQRNNFFQLQFGYSILLSSVVGKIQPK